MNDIVLRALIAACVFLALLGIACLTRPHREKPRNIRRECGNTVPRRPNVRRPAHATGIAREAVRTGDFLAVDADGGIRPATTIPVFDWSDEPTVTSPRGES